MLRMIIDFLGDLGEGGIIAVVLLVMVLVFIVPAFWPFVHMAMGG